MHGVTSQWIASRNYLCSYSGLLTWRLRAAYEAIEPVATGVSVTIYWLAIRLAHTGFRKESTCLGR